MDVRDGLSGRGAHGRPSAVTIGFFDGVHRGHQEVVARTVDVARRRDLGAVAVTFDRHPREVYAPGTEPPLLTTLERKAALLEPLGLDELVVLAFTEDFSRWTPQEFVDRVVVDGLAARHVVVGSNFTFGHKAAGTLATLRDLGEARGFGAEGRSLLTIDGRPVSSSSIREALLAGDLRWPARALGRRFAVDGRVVRGAGRGAGLGWPTANLEVPGRMLIPGGGIYAGTATVDAGTFAAAVSVGTNPTFGSEPLHVEAFLLDFDADVVGAPMSVEFWQRLRDEERFDSAEELSRQIKDDVERTRSIVRDAG
jgi:riboflavin kinase/FMN adenylyltransferase